jgi:hypothetical protein
MYIYLSAYSSFIVQRHCRSVKAIDLTNFTKICKYVILNECFFRRSPITTNVFYFLFFFISFLWLLNFLH